eukprot:6593912-Karenia_brevis.AAC.1
MTVASTLCLTAYTYNMVGARVAGTDFIDSFNALVIFISSGRQFTGCSLVRPGLSAAVFIFER